MTRGLPEYARRAALAAAHLEARHPKDALIAAEAVRNELGEDYLGRTPDGLWQIRCALNGLSLTTPRSRRVKLRVIPGGRGAELL